MKLLELARKKNEKKEMKMKTSILMKRFLPMVIMNKDTNKKEKVAINNQFLTSHKSRSCSYKAEL